jgi:UDP-GlcNAc:undecaprenyl-phosphate GlcNAc-1-phosphate transferase
MTILPLQQATLIVGAAADRILCLPLDSNLSGAFSFFPSGTFSVTAGLKNQNLASTVGHGWAGFCLAFLITLLIALLAIKWIGPLGFLDHPGGRKQHQRPIPRVGGLALVASLALAGSLGWLDGVFSPIAWTCLGAMALIGLLDDRFDLRARWKAIAGLAIGLFLAILGAIELLSHSGEVILFGTCLSDIPLLMGTLLLMLFWAIPQAFNLIDGADGLALGFTLITLAVLALAGSPVPYAMGAVAALFALNWPRSRLFLGDCGSLFLGLLTAMLAFKTFGHTKPEAILWLLAYPTADVIQVVTVRLATGRSLGRADRNHFHHRWKDALGNWSRLRVPILWVQGALCASGAILEGPWKSIAWVGLAGLVLQCCVFVCMSIRRHHQRMLGARIPARSLRTEPQCVVQTEKP